MILAKDKTAILEFLHRLHVSGTTLTDEQVEEEAERVLALHVMRLERDKTYHPEDN